MKDRAECKVDVVVRNILTFVGAKRKHIFINKHIYRTNPHFSAVEQLTKGLLVIKSIIPSDYILLLLTWHLQA